MSRVVVQGPKQVAEAVIIAGLSALVTGIVNWALERAKQKAARKQAASEGGAE